MRPAAPRGTAPAKPDSERQATARYAFLGGKGGVGKTTCAAAYAIGRAKRGAHVLVVSTDPAHSLGDALGRKLSGTPATVRRGLAAVELAADRALERWIRERRDVLVEIGDRGTWLDRDDVERLLSLSFPGVDELVALLEITRLGESGRWDEVVVDTAPTGHALRMLDMPATLERIAGVLDDMDAKHRVIAESLGGGRLGEDEAGALIEEIRGDAGRLATILRDPERASFRWVCAAEPLAIAEAADALAGLATRGIAVSELVFDRLTPAPARPCALCSGRRAAERAVLDSLPPPLASVPRREIAEAGRDVLAAVERALFATRRPSRGRRPRDARPRGRTERPERSRPAPTPIAPGVRLVLVGGKGGVGKSTCAAALALDAVRASPGIRTLLLSIDPAHSLADVLDRAVPTEAAPLDNGPPNLHVRELDAAEAFARLRDRYRGAVDALFDRLRGGSRFDAAYDRAIVRDLLDLAPPGLDEIFGMLAVVDALGLGGTRASAPYGRVVLDTAPTGHALRLLEMPAKAAEWVRTLLEVLHKYRGAVKPGALAEDLLALSRDLRALRALLGDPARTAFVVVARPEPLVVAETRRLLKRLRSHRVPVGALLVNAVADPRLATCAPCRARARRERAEITVLSGAARGCAIIHAPLTVPLPRGPAGLRAFRGTWREASHETPTRRPTRRR